ncbi:polysaccharide biosynthesis tyrosine autokinase [Synechococcus sp. CBW1004]|uniref:GumC family protein n=1 Tax=Synechococcus sp. CBW1004 TaxID=1353136 RepID=UPI0018CF89DA|nr:polysaccharide biosynthesis tyrosine autokinase [Synechococcus sp. CBW1004]QPN64284.1 polysaccharide biosynthesis tyrosine autokinase [Synechococcus sp. CBW1004]
MAYRGSPLSADLGVAGTGDQGSDFNFASLLRTIKRRQGLFLFTFAVVTGALAANTLRQRIFSPVYRGGFLIQVRNPFESRTAGTNQAEGMVGAIARSNYNADTNSLTVLLRSPLLIRPLAEQQGVRMNELINNLRISPASTGSGGGDASTENVLNVTLNWSNPVQGRQILSELSKIYTRFSLIQRQEALDSGIKFLDRQAPEIQQRVALLQNDMLRFRERNNNLDPSANAQAILATREGLLQQLRALQTQQVELNSRLASIASGRLQWSPSGAPTAVEQLGRQGIATPGRGAGAEVAAGTPTPLEQLNQFETDLATARATYREDSPIVQSILARRNSLLPVVRRQAADNVRAQLLANVAQQDEINRQILLLNQNFRNNPQKMREFEDLQSRLNLAREHYISYIQARESFRLELARSTTPWQVISPAEFADIPVEPNIQRSLLKALLIGLLAGFGAALIRERTDHVFYTPMDAERDLQLPVLGLIPFLPLDPGVEISSSIAKMSSSERFAIKESLRSLFTTFRLLRADRNIRMVGVTSSTQGEGKSTAVTIFARTLADLGLKVLVIDADMRLPMQSRYVGVEQGEGLSNLLSDSTLRASELILTVADNFDILPAGPKPPDPAKLLNSNRCQEVVEEVRNLPGYDMVLWDAPPCLMLADPILLGEKLDGILFLVGLGKVNRELAPQACRRIKATGVDVLGLICNQVTFPSRLNDYGYEYGYYYHYAYSDSYSNSTFGNYERNLKGYIKSYRDSYLRRDGNGSGSSYISNRYLRDVDTVQSYQQADSDSFEAGGRISDTETSPPPRSEAGTRRHRHRRRTRLQRAVGWLRERLPLPGQRR